MRFRGFLIVALAAIGVGSMVSLAGIWSGERILIRHSSAALTESARALASFIPAGAAGVSPSAADYRDFCARAARDSRFRITLIDASGNVIADSSYEPDLMDNHASRPEVRDALLGKESWARRKSGTAHAWMLYAAVPLQPAAGTGAVSAPRVLRLALELPAIREQAEPLRLTFAILGAAAILASIAASTLLARLFSSPVRRLAERARGYAAGGHRSTADRSSIAAGNDILPPEFQVLETAMDAMAEDLTRKASEAERLGARYAGILDSAGEGIIAVDDRLSIIEANQAAHTLLDAPADSLRGTDLAASGISDTIISLCRETLASRRAQETQLSLYLSGERSLKVKTTHFGTGTFSGAVITLGDISALKRLERIRTDFVANVSHELRTPIHLIQGFAETLAKDLAGEPGPSAGANREGALHYLEIISRNALRMERIIADLLALARLERDPATWLTTEECRAEQILQDLIATARHIAAPKSVELMTVLRGDGRFRANAGLMEQALFNLAENAIRYSPAGGIVRIEYDGDGQTASFTVRDQGPGIPAADLPRIFERFYRADKSRDRKSGGTGLGLAIVRHIALSHGGDVEAESWAGEGSAFRIRIPRDPAPRP